MAPAKFEIQLSASQPNARILGTALHMYERIINECVLKVLEFVHRATAQTPVKDRIRLLFGDTTINTLIIDDTNRSQ